MAKFTMECPTCKRYTEAKTGFFRKKRVILDCGHEIKVGKNILSKSCPHCANTVVYDPRDAEEALCPLCKGTLNTTQDILN